MKVSILKLDKIEKKKIGQFWRIKLWKNFKLKWNWQDWKYMEKWTKLKILVGLWKKKIEKLKKLYTWKGLKKWTKLLKSKKLEKCRTEKDLKNQRICRNWKKKRIEKKEKKKKIVKLLIQKLDKIGNQGKMYKWNYLGSRVYFEFLF